MIAFIICEEVTNENSLLTPPKYELYVYSVRVSAMKALSPRQGHGLKLVSCEFLYNR